MTSSLAASPFGSYGRRNGDEIEFLPELGDAQIQCAELPHVKRFPAAIMEGLSRSGHGAGDERARQSIAEDRSE